PEAALYKRFRRAYPFREIERTDFAAVVQMLADGFATRRGRRGALIHRDAVNGVLRARRGARMIALTSGGTIPDTADYQVLLEPDNHIIGSVNEDFAVESLAGDVFQLGLSRGAAGDILSALQRSDGSVDVRSDLEKVPFHKHVSRSGPGKPISN